MTAKKRPQKLIPREAITRKIIMLRGKKMMLDSDLAEVYGVTTKRLNEQVKRNRLRFPEDFMFQLTNEESECLRSQIATLKTGRCLIYIDTEGTQLYSIYPYYEPLSGSVFLQPYDFFSCYHALLELYFSCWLLSLLFNGEYILINLGAASKFQLTITFLPLKERNKTG